CACGCGASLEGQNPTVLYASRSCAEGKTSKARSRGDYTPSEREMIPILRNDPCSYCGGPAGTIDHIDPVHYDGGRVWENLTAACQPCNSSKHTRPLLTFLLGAGQRISVPSRSGQMPPETPLPVPVVVAPEFGPAGDPREWTISLRDAISVAFEICEDLGLPMSSAKEIVDGMVKAAEDEDEECPDSDDPLDDPHTAIGRLFAVRLSRHVSEEAWEAVSERVVDEMLAEAA